MPCDIAISIINFRTADLTIACVASVLAHMEGTDCHIVVVDNQSGDGSMDAIEDWLAAQPGDLPVTLVRSPTNTGFSGGHNQGIAAIEAEFYLLLNSDAVLRPGFLPTILQTARAHPSVGLFAPRIVHEDGAVQDSCFRFASPASELIRTARSGFVTRAFQRRNTSLGPQPDPEHIEWASFACILLRAEMVRRIGPMDEGYFLYFEDAEYCLRARRAGWSILQEPQAEVVHFRGGSGPVKSLSAARARLPRYFYSSRTRFLYQAHGITGLIAANCAWYLGRFIRNAARLTGKRISPMPKGEWRDIWTNITQPLGPRYAPGDPQ